MNTLIGKGICIFLLSAFFVAVHFPAFAQKVRPKWVDDFKGNSGASEATAVAVDQQNNIYVTGWFFGTVDFDPSANVKNLTSVGGTDVFVGKYKSDGTLIWVESFGGTGNESPKSIAVDKDGNISIAGSYGSLIFDVDPGPGVHDLYTLVDNTGGFLVHLDTNGAFVWANSLANNTSNTGSVGYYMSVTSDSQDDVIATSVVPMYGTVGDTTYTQPAKLIIKYSALGNLLWSINLQNLPFQPVGHGSPFGIAVDSENNLVISGLFGGTVNFNPLGAAYSLTTPDFFTYFLVKYSSAGALIWVNPIYSGGTNEAVYPVVSIDKQNDIYFTTTFYPTLTFGTTTLNYTGDGLNECIAKYSSAGDFQFAKGMGGPTNTGYSGIGIQNAIATDKNNNIYLSGYLFGSINLDPKLGAAGNLTAHGQQDFYIAKYDSIGNYVHAFSAGSPNCSNTYGTGLAIDTNNNANVAGSFCSTVNFDPSGCSPITETATSPADPFLAQYTSSALTNNIITAPTVSSFCTNGSPDAITGSLPTDGSGTYTYQWLSSADSVTFTDINGATAQNYTPPTLTTTTYYERMVNFDTCTVPTVSNIVGLHVFPALAVPVVTIVALTQSSVIIRWAAIPNATGYQVSIDNGETYTPVSGLTDTISGLKPGQNLTITVEATGTIACQLSVSAAVIAKVPAGDIIYCPNAFTPNGDGRNDVWNVEGENIGSIRFFIYDQWGELLFTSTSLQNGWDGTYKGTKEPVGVYAYYVEAVMNDGQNIKKKGTINLLR